MADEQQKQSSNSFLLKRLKFGLEKTDQNKIALTQFLNFFKKNKSSLLEYENKNIPIPPLNQVSSAELIFTAKEKNKEDNLHLYVSDIVSIFRDIENQFLPDSTTAKNFAAKYLGKEDASIISSDKEREKLLNNENFWLELQGVADTLSGLLTLLTEDKKEVIEEDKETKKSGGIGQEQFATVETKAAPADQNEKSGDQTITETTKTEKTQKSLFLSREDRVLLDGFAQITINASFYTLGFDKLKFENLSIEQQAVLRDCARESVSSVLLRFKNQGKNLSDGVIRLELLREARKAFLLNPVNYNLILKTANDKFKTLDAEGKKEFTNNLDEAKKTQQQKQTLKDIKPKDLKTSVDGKKISLENLNEFKPQTTEQYKNIFIDYISQFSQDPQTTILLAENITNTIDSFITINYKPTFLDHLDFNKYSLIFGDGINPQVFAQKELKNSFISALKEYWLFRQAELSAINQNLSSDYNELDIETLNNPQKLQKRLVPVTTVRNVYKNTGSQEISDTGKNFALDLEKEANKSLWQQLKPEEQRAIWQNIILNQVDLARQDFRIAPDQFRYAEVQQIKIVNTYSNNLYRQNFADMGENGEVVFSSPPSSIFNNPQTLDKNLDRALNTSGQAIKKAGDFAAEKIGDLALKGAAALLGAPGADKIVNKLLNFVPGGKNIKKIVGYIVMFVAVPLIGLLAGGLFALIRFVFTGGGLFGPNGLLTGKKLISGAGGTTSGVAEKKALEKTTATKETLLQQANKGIKAIGGNIGIAAPVAGLSITALLTYMTVTNIETAFLANFPIGDNLSNDISPFVDIEKTANPDALENGETQDIQYTITITPKENYIITPIPDESTDVISYVGGEALTYESPIDEIRSQLGSEAITEAKTITYTISGVSGTDVMMTNLFKLAFVVDGEKATASAMGAVKIGDPDIGCFVFGPSGFNIGDGFISVSWTESEKNQVEAAYASSGGMSDKFNSLLCSSGPLTIYRLAGNAYGGWAPSAQKGKVVALYDLPFTVGTLKYTFVHELGHIIDYRNAGLRRSLMSLPPTTNTCYTYPFPSECNESETFAEGTALYVVNDPPLKGVTYNFRSMHSKDYAWYKENIFGGVEY